MGTRATIEYEGLPIKLYRHWDGYPDTENGVLASLVPFTRDFLENRGDDEMYFMARLVENQIKATGHEGQTTGFGLAPTDWDVGEQFRYVVKPKEQKIEVYTYRGKLVQSVPILLAV